MGTVFRDYSIINDGLFKITYSEDGSNVSNLLSMSTGQTIIKTPLKVEGSSLLEGLAWMKDDALLETGNLVIGVGIGALNNITDRIHLNGSMAITNKNYIEFGKGLEKDENAGRIFYNEEDTRLEIIGAGIEFGERNIFLNDNVIIGNKNNGPHSDSRLFVDGKITAKYYIATLDNWPDYVFEKDYYRMPLYELKDFINKNGHLPSIPSADYVNSNGVDLGELNKKLLEKVEELTLYVIELKEQIDTLNDNE
ncbi:hypothetical protein HZR84_03825 [Hyphobacterium sp. CCMP332]|nr:hypothetical protein HZR84_03825 [Hyphobacterium sp. CCMP332]